MIYTILYIFKYIYDIYFISYKKYNILYNKTYITYRHTHTRIYIRQFCGSFVTLGRSKALTEAYKMMVGFSNL